MAKQCFLSVRIRAVANGFEADVNRDYFRSSDTIMSENTYVFQTFDALSRWLKENIKPLGE